MTNQQLVEYITQQQTNGVPETQIRSELVGNGWQESDINDAFTALSSNSADLHTSSGAQDNKWLITFLLAWCLGMLGIHRFYVGKNGTGVAMLLLSFSVIGYPVSFVWAIVDIIKILLEKFTDKNGNSIRAQSQKLRKILSSVYVACLLFFVAMIPFTIWLIIATSSGVRDVSHEFVNKMSVGQIEEAYMNTHSGFRRDTSIEEFHEFVEEYEAYIKNGTLHIDSFSITNEMGDVEGVITTSDGVQSRVLFELIRTDGEWKILYVQIIPVTELDEG